MSYICLEIFTNDVHYFVSNVKLEHSKLYYGYNQDTYAIYGYAAYTLQFNKYTDIYKNIIFLNSWNELVSNFLMDDTQLYITYNQYNGLFICYIKQVLVCSLQKTTNANMKRYFYDHCRIFMAIRARIVSSTYSLLPLFVTKINLVL